MFGYSHSNFETKNGIYYEKYAVFYKKINFKTLNSQKGAKT